MPESSSPTASSVSEDVSSPASFTKNEPMGTYNKRVGVEKWRVAGQ
jgi:hypothetical protein